ncbi:class II aldolase/adducin family protein [Halalkalibacter wakoensis JCM 9140]|uniref:Class II aldolase/adducin family protein n=1 Tax=Halalkalibacter wakoensis JCM 9140 TaxID=1236970 RepID=W4Q7C9_9BACI|nr:class II aldolase/adducin family protein [Halalkalibacter wakoensis]GAE27598.1 class II aldolase/adducin family protein [Halalkalibacter wakoensis JCM 9140]
MASIKELKEKVARSCQILAMEGQFDGILGHVSVRIDENKMLIRCRGPKEKGLLYTTPDDIKIVDFDGNGEFLEEHKPPNELPVHGEIYKVRKNVNCVVHSHPPEAVICSISNIPLKPIIGAFNIPAARMAREGIPLFEHSYLITKPEQAQEMIKVMGERDVVLLRGHGITVTGMSIEEATVQALTLNQLAKTTLKAVKSGFEPVEIPPEDFKDLPDLGTQFNAQLNWNYLEHKLFKLLA